MKSAMQIIHNMRKSPQYQKSIIVMSLFSKYRAYSGYELPKSRVLDDLNINSSEYNDLIAGSPNIKVDKYNFMIEYLRSQCRRVRASYTVASNYVMGSNPLHLIVVTRISSFIKKNLSYINRNPKENNHDHRNNLNKKTMVSV